MISKRRLIRNLFILIVLILIASSFSAASFTPLAAHKRSEKTANYGPSVIIKSQEIKGGMLYLCKYDKWYSLNTVKKGRFGLWYAGNQVHGKENDINTPIDYNWGTIRTFINNVEVKFYGIVNDPNIKSVKLIISVKSEIETFLQEELYDNMFLFTWGDNTVNYEGARLIGLDKDSNIIFEKPLP